MSHANHVPGVLTESQLESVADRRYRVEVRVFLEVSGESLLSDYLTLPNGELCEMVYTGDTYNGADVVAAGDPVPSCMICNAARWATNIMQDAIDDPFEVASIVELED